jgi:hypothetical protein
MYSLTEIAVAVSKAVSSAKISVDSREGRNAAGILPAGFKTIVHGGTDGAYDCFCGVPLQKTKEGESK